MGNNPGVICQASISFFTVLKEWVIDTCSKLHSQYDVLWFHACTDAHVQSLPAAIAAAHAKSCQQQAMSVLLMNLEAHY